MVGDLEAAEDETEVTMRNSVVVKWMICDGYTESGSIWSSRDRDNSVGSEPRERG